MTSGTNTLSKRSKFLVSRASQYLDRQLEIASWSRWLVSRDMSKYWWSSFISLVFSYIMYVYVYLFNFVLESCMDIFDVLCIVRNPAGIHAQLLGGQDS
jgi:hypothetical protein